MSLTLTNYQQLVIALVKPFQELQGVYDQMQLLLNIYNATGWVQDLIGKIVGQPRNGLDDDTYRVYQLARVATNRSQGKREQLIRICRLVLNNSAAKVRVLNEGTAGLTIWVDNFIPSTDTADALIQFLRVAVGGGIKIVLETMTASDDLSFTFGLSTFATSGITAGDTTISADTSGFPFSGSLVLDSGLTVEETVTYTGISSTTFLGVSAPVHNHSSGSEIQSVEGSPGLGFALSAFSSGSISAGATSIQVPSTSGFPSSGTLDVDAGLTGAETIAYASIDGTHFLGIPATGPGSLANPHVSGTELQFSGTPQIGGDFADARS
jgi:hypothetical protein